MAISLTELRKHIFTEMDKVIKTGQPLEIERKGHRLKIMLDQKRSKLTSLVSRENVVTCTDEELITNDWIKEWNHAPNND